MSTSTQKQPRGMFQKVRTIKAPKTSKRKATKSDLIRAVYLIEQNENLSPAKTVELVKQYFNVDIERTLVYAFRSHERKHGRLTPHDRTAKFTESGFNSARFTIKNVTLKI